MSAVSLYTTRITRARYHSATIHKFAVALCVAAAAVAAAVCWQVRDARSHCANVALAAQCVCVCVRRSPAVALARPLVRALCVVLHRQPQRRRLIDARARKGVARASHMQDDGDDDDADDEMMMMLDERRSESSQDIHTHGEK